MKNIIPLLQCIRPVVGATSLRQLSRIAKAILAMEGPVTLLGMSRWTPGGGSYPTVQRFFYTVLPWATMLWVFFQEHLFNKDHIYLLPGDDVRCHQSWKRNGSISILPKTRSALSPALLQG